MDRPIPDPVRRRRTLRRLAVAAAAAVAVAAVAGLTFHAAGGLLGPTIKRSRMRTSVVERGVVEASISARGRITPAYEHVITSPIDTRVTRVLKTPGSGVHPGEAILLLDVNASELALQQLEDKLALKRNQYERAQVELETSLSDLRGQKAIKELELESARFEATRDRHLVELGVTSEDQARQSAAGAARTEIELQQIEARIENTRRSLAVQLEGLSLELAILEKDRDEQAHQLQLAAAASDRAGVLTWVLPSEGMAVRRGDEIARVADLSRLGVEATVSDIHAASVAPGMEAEVGLGDLSLRGKVSAVRPTVEEGAVVFEVALDEPDHPALRPNLRVDVYVVTERREGVLRVARGTYTQPDGTHTVFVVRGDTAVRTPVEFGIANTRSYEVLSGLSPGDEVIVSDTSDYLHLKEVRLR